jgi:hypothetical protein
MMRRAWIITCVLLVMTLACSTVSLALTLNFASVDGAAIAFTGTDSTFSFPNTGQYDFVINNEKGGSSAGGLHGNIDGVFKIGAITIAGPYETANVTGPGTFSIDDGAGKTLTGDLVWPAMDAITYTPDISSGFLNTGGTANITNIQYTGLNADLLTLRNNQPATSIVTFQFINPGQSLTDLATGGALESTSISGSLSVKGDTPVPIPPTVLLMGSGLVGLIGLGYRRKRKI